jgi:aryl-alcohol dehydrogenase-like predicted oxidoreductase
VNTRWIDSLQVSSIGLGTASFAKYADDAACIAMVQAAIECGVTLFDTADSYGTGRCGRAEEVLGRALRGHRDEVVVASKVGTDFAGQPATASGQWIRRGVTGSLRRLGTDYLDLYLLHVPDQAVPIEETLAAMAGLRDSGLVRVIGCCNLSAAQLAAARVGTPSSFRCVQDEYSMLGRAVEAAVLPLCLATGTAFVAYAPLCYGLLTGKYASGVPTGSRLARLGPAKAAAIRTPTAIAQAARLCHYSRLSGLPQEQVALAWLLSRPGVTAVIPGATTAAQVRRNVAADDLVPLAAAAMADIDALIRPAQ